MKIKALTISVVLFAAFAVSSLAAAAPKVYSDVKMQVSLPDGWKVKDAKNGITMVGAPANDAGVIIFPVVNPTPDAIKKSVGDLLASMNGTAITWNDQLAKDTINGLPIFARQGSGTFDGKTDDLMTILILNGANGLVFVAIVPHDKTDTYKAALSGMIHSIAPTK